MGEKIESNHEIEAQNTLVIKAIEEFTRKKLQTLDHIDSHSIGVNILRRNINAFLLNPVLKPNVLSSRGMTLSQEKVVATSIYLQKGDKKLPILILEDRDWMQDVHTKTADERFQLGAATLSGLEFGLSSKE